MLGISIYPYKENIDETLKYIELAAKYNYKRVFLNLIILNGMDIQKVIELNKIVIDKCNSYGMEVICDVNPQFFQLLNLSLQDLKFFKELGVSGIRIDEIFNGYVESEMSYNEYGLKIELNLSQNTKYIDNIFSTKPNKRNIIGCHNFYPQRYSGLSEDFFLKTTKKYYDMGIRTAAFVASQKATHGPHDFDDSLVTIENHRDKDIYFQTKYFIATGIVDDIIISNAFASEEELKGVSEIYKDYLVFDFIPDRELSEVEKVILTENLHKNRQDANDIVIRSSCGRIKNQKDDIEIKTPSIEFKTGDICICNNSFSQYKGELDIFKTTLHLKEKIGLRNKIGKIRESEVELLKFVDDNFRFKFRIVGGK